MDYKYYLALLVAVALSACGGEREDRGDGGDNDEETQHLTFSDFAIAVSESAAVGADDCGIVEVGESELEANTCVADAYVYGRAFYAVYELQGIDSNVGAAWSGNTSGEVFLWHYDSHPGGGLSDLASVIETSECISPELSGTVDGSFENVFTCDSFESREPGETAGPCVHNYYESVMNIDRVIANPANTEIGGVSLNEVVHDDVEVQLEAWCDGQADGLCYGLSFENEAPVCSLPCGFGTEEGEWRIELSAEGYQPATVTLDASYGEHEGGCPSYSDDGSHFELELNES